MFGNIYHFIFHVFSQIFKRCMVYRLIRGEAGCLDYFSDPHSVKLDPDIFPRKFFVCNVCVDLTRKNHEALAAVNLIFMGLPFCIVGDQSAGAGYYIMKQIVVSCGRPERMGRRALLFSELIQPRGLRNFHLEIQKTVNYS